MKHKVGQCKDCPRGGLAKPLTAGRCSLHYWQYRAKVNRDKPYNKARAARKDVLGEWFSLQIEICPKACENCGKPIYSPTRTNIAHILPKAIFEEVATHPLNRWFACWQCHTNYDQWPVERVATMPIIVIARNRASQFLPLVLRINRHRVPIYLENQPA